MTNTTNHPSDIDTFGMEKDEVWTPSSDYKPFPVQGEVDEDGLKIAVKAISNGHIVYETSIGSIKEAKIKWLNDVYGVMEPSYIKQMAKFPTQSQDFILKLYKMGYSPAYIAREGGVSKQFVNIAIALGRRFGLFPQVKPDVKNEEILREGRRKLAAIRLQQRLDRLKKKEAEAEAKRQAKAAAIAAKTAAAEAAKLKFQNGDTRPRSNKSQLEALAALAEKKSEPQQVTPAPAGKSRIVLDLDPEQMAKLLALLNATK